MFICTLLLTRATLSKYVSITSASDSAVAAKFNITADLSEFASSFNAFLTPDMRKENAQNCFVLSVNNNSETKVMLSAVVETEGNLPIGIICKKAVGEGYEQLSVYENQEDYTFRFTDEMDIGGNGQYEIYVIWDELRDADKTYI